MSEAQRLIRLVLTLAAGISAVVLCETLLNVWLAAGSVSRVFSFNAAEARFVVGGLSGNFNQLLAIAFTTVAIAVPLTANMYSVKFLDLFIHDRVTQVVLGIFIFALPHNTWLMHNLKDDYVPVIQLYLSLGLVVLCPAILIAYLYYLFHFLHPNTLLQRLEKEIAEEIITAQRQPTRAAARAHAASDLIEHVASIAIRSVDRADRATAIETVAVLKRLMQLYLTQRTQMPKAWFIADWRTFRTFSSEMVLEISESRRWFEMKIFSQLREVLSAAIPRMHDLANAIANVMGELGVEKEAAENAAYAELIVEYFNTFLRLAINRRDQRSVFTLFNQYRQFAESLCHSYPEMLLEIGFYFQYYAQAARDQGLTFVVEATAHDLAGLVRTAWEQRMPKWEKLLERFLLFDQETQAQPLLGVKKAQVILAGFFLLHEMPEQAQLISESLKELEPKFVEKMKDDLLHVRRDKYWEIGERRIHIDYVSPAHREKIAQFFEGLARS